MALTAGGLPYVEASDLVSGYPAVSLALAEELDDQLALKAPLASPTFTGTVDLTGATVTGISTASGLVLVTPTSIANSGGSSSASGGAVTFTGVSSISLNGVFTSTYDNYLVLVTGYGSTDDKLTMRLRASGTDDSSSNYHQQQLVASAGTVNSARTSSRSLVDVGDFFSAEANGLKINLYRPAVAIATAMTTEVAYSSTTSPTVVLRDLRHNVATAYDGFTLIPASGTLTGKVRVYGYQNS